MYKRIYDPMHLHRKLEDAELIDLLAVHTNRLTQIMISGESYDGEYEACRCTIELIQNEILSRRGFYLKTVSYQDHNDNMLPRVNEAS